MFARPKNAEKLRSHWTKIGWLNTQEVTKCNCKTLRRSVTNKTLWPLCNRFCDRFSPEFDDFFWGTSVNCSDGPEKNDGYRVRCIATGAISTVPGWNQLIVFSTLNQVFFWLIVTYEAWTSTLCMSDVLILWVYLMALIRFGKGSRMLARTFGEHLRLPLLLPDETQLFAGSCHMTMFFASFQGFSEKILWLLVGIFHCWLISQPGHCKVYSLNTFGDWHWGFVYGSSEKARSNDRSFEFRVLGHAQTSKLPQFLYFYLVDANV